MMAEKLGREMQIGSDKPMPGLRIPPQFLTPPHKLTDTLLQVPSESIHDHLDPPNQHMTQHITPR